MRPSTTVARAALTAVLALGALPGLVGSREPKQDLPIDAASFEQVFLATTRDRQGIGAIVLDSAGRSAGALDAFGRFSEPQPGAVLQRLAAVGPDRPWPPALPCG
jgi:hypothetical protein